MRFTLRTALLAGAVAVAFSAAARAGELEDKLAAKMGKDFVKNASWITDYDQALAEAKKSNKLIFAYFTRSYAP